MSQQTPTKSDADPKSISIEQAKQTILANLPLIRETEVLSVAKAAGRVLAEDVVSPINVPPFRASAMDGYAYRHAERQNSLTISDKSLAGHPSTDQANANECHRITTGARVPNFADTVVQQENVKINEGTVHIQQHSDKGFHVRPVGSDSLVDSLLMQAGQRLAAAQIACLFSHGIINVKVLRPVRIAVFSTGDELCEPGTALNDGNIYDANRALLTSLLASSTVQVTDLGIVKDSIEALQNVFERCKGFDMVLSSGGVSVGDADFVRPVLAEHGDLHIWKVAMKPGRPLTFGLLHKHQPYFGLPGNPVSAALTCLVFVIPAVQTLLLQTPAPLPKLKAKLIAELKKLPGRVEYQRGMLELDKSGNWMVSTTGLQDSHVITSLHRANCFIELGFESEGASSGEMVSVIPFEHFGDSIL